MRRRFWPMLGATIGLLLQQQVASAQTLKLATLAPDGSVWDSALKEMGADWQQISGGEVTLRVYPGGVAGDDADMVRKMRIGQLQAGALTVAGLSEIDDASTSSASRCSSTPTTSSSTCSRRWNRSSSNDSRPRAASCSTGATAAGLICSPPGRCARWLISGRSRSSPGPATSGWSSGGSATASSRCRWR